MTLVAQFTAEIANLEKKASYVILILKKKKIFRFYVEKTFLLQEMVGGWRHKIHRKTPVPEPLF